MTMMNFRQRYLYNHNLKCSSIDEFHPNDEYFIAMINFHDNNEFFFKMMNLNHSDKFSSQLEFVSQM